MTRISELGMESDYHNLINICQTPTVNIILKLMVKDKCFLPTIRIKGKMSVLVALEVVVTVVDKKKKRPTYL